MPTAKPGPWLQTAIDRSLIALPVQTPAPPASCSEATFQRHVVELAERLGWRCYHTFDSRRSAAGWPDLTMLRAGVLILAELKTDRGEPTAEQTAWLTELRAVRGIVVRLWRPSDWAAIVRELRGGHPHE